MFLLIVGQHVPLDRRWKQVVPPRESPPAGGPPPDLLQECHESCGLQPLQVPHRRRRRQAPPDMARAGLQGVRDREWDGVSVKNKKREGLDGNLENGGKWRLTRKDGFGQALAKLTACDYHGGRRQYIHGHFGNFKI
jgi:hypothetical protein